MPPADIAEAPAFAEISMGYEDPLSIRFISTNKDAFEG
jgi:hypothetical protein